MRLFALIHDNMIVGLEHALTNPFHRAAKVVDVTGATPRIGDTIDQHGNTAPASAMGLGEAAIRNRKILRGIAHGRILLGVELDGIKIDTNHESLAVLSALAEADSDLSIDMDGNPVELRAYDALTAAGQYIDAVLRREMELADAIKDDANVDLTQGWPESVMTLEDQDDHVIAVGGNAPTNQEPPAVDPGTSADATLINGTVPNPETAPAVVDNQPTAPQDAEQGHDGERHDGEQPSEEHKQEG